MYSRKTKGNVSQGFTISVDDNKLLRRAAALDRRSIRSWILKTLISTAKREIKKHLQKNGE